MLRPSTRCSLSPVPPGSSNKTVSSSEDDWNWINCCHVEEEEEDDEEENRYIIGRNHFTNFYQQLITIRVSPAEYISLQMGKCKFTN